MKKAKLYKSLLILLLIAAMLSGCYNPSKLSYFNISSSYEDQAKSLGLQFNAYNFSELQVKLFYKLNTSGLLFIKHKTKDFFFAKYQISYEVYDNTQPKILLDSATLRFTDSTNFISRNQILDSFLITANKAVNYIVAYEFTDLNRKYTLNGFINIDKSNEFSRNNFLLRDDNKLPVIENFVNKGQSIRVLLNQKIKKKLYVSYYNQEFPLAEPPYTQSSGTLKPFDRDSLFIIDLKQGWSDKIVLNNPGIYFFQTDTSQLQGLTVYRFYNNFPLVTTPVQMLGPLRYITTKQEYNDLKNAKNIKTSIDNFWVIKTGNIDRAQELIKLFYNRVQDANVLFTSYKEGWKTDRGMIYLVLGPPSRVYRSASIETWFYGEDRNMQSITLNFTKKQEKFSDNDYILDRGAEYKEAWYNGVESWRM